MCWKHGTKCTVAPTWLMSMSDVRGALGTRGRSAAALGAVLISPASCDMVTVATDASRALLRLQWLAAIRLCVRPVRVRECLHASRVMAAVSKPTPANAIAAAMLQSSPVKGWSGWRGGDNMSQQRCSGAV